ncbi:MAG: 2-hydroxyacyl-CoA dehydratase [Deltaproteobacteria bacterium]|nr:2-hydroxyacyl-CoA dehydratase [Candidatus Zymogenaceae bacterium]
MSPIDLSPFQQAVTSRTQRLRQLGQTTKIFGWFCTYTPIEIIHAAGFLPIRISGGTTRIEKANTLVPSFICPYLRACLERAMGGQYDYLSGIVTGYTCDAACGMINIWEENIPAELFHTIPLPYHTNDPATTFYRRTLGELTEGLEAVGGTVSDTSLARSLDLFGEIRALMHELYELRYDNRLPLSGREFYTVLEACFGLPPEEYRPLLTTLVKSAREGNTSHRRGIPILVSGSLVEEMRIYDVIEATGGRTAADDLCTGYRFIDPADGSGPTPMDRLIDRYQRRFPCPARSVVGERTGPIKRLIERSGARGVVFIFQKFCTPHLADYPALSEDLKGADIPVLLVEMEETGINEGQLTTRLEGFFEMIGP